MTNVKAGDLAIVKSTKPQYNGRIVEILYPAPAIAFRLPNGRWHDAPISHPSWVLKCIGAPMSAPLSGGGWKDVWYGVGSDAHLRPLPGDPEEASEQTEQPVAVTGEST